MSLIRVLRLFAVLTLMQFMPSLACAASDPAEPELQLRIGDVLAVTLPGLPHCYGCFSCVAVRKALELKLDIDQQGSGR